MSKAKTLKVCGLILCGLILSIRAIASGDETEAIIWVADTRHLSGLWRWIASMYNEAPYLHALFVITITAVQGIVLGFAMDWLMKLTGIELSERELRE